MFITYAALATIHYKESTDPPNSPSLNSIITQIISLPVRIPFKLHLSNNSSNYAPLPEDVLFP